ncbi:hypothetical protein L8S23_10370, partial [Enterobacter bugandensis]
SAIYSRTRASLKALNRSETTLMLLLKNYWGSLSPVGEGWGEGNSPHNTPSFPTMFQRIIPALLSIFSSEAL